MRPGIAPFRRRPSRRSDLLVALWAALFLAWSFVPAWYRAPGGTVGGASFPPAFLSAWDGPTAPAAVLAAVAVAWVGLRAGRELRRPGPLVAVDAALPIAALLLTLMGTVFRREGAFGAAAPAWGLAVGVVVALAWTLSAVRALREASASHLGHP
jgi:hypothetical protein